MLIGKPPGLRFKTADGLSFVCIRPTLEDYILKIVKRHTQVIYPKDLGSLLVRGDLYPGARVLEAGMGTGAAAHLLRRMLGPHGLLISYERRPEFAERTRLKMEEFNQLYGTLVAPHQIEVRDVYDGIAASDLDTILLDLPEPHNVLEDASRALRVNGILLCWLPTVIQVFDLVQQLQTHQEHWADIRTTELLQRHWQVSTQSIRPAQRMVGHTGFLISARRVESVPFTPAQEPEI